MSRGSLRFTEAEYKAYAAKAGFKVGTIHCPAAPDPPALTPPHATGDGGAPLPLSTQIVHGLCTELKIPWPVLELKFHPNRKWRFDFAWVFGDPIALEVEGGVWTRGRHTRGAGFLADMEKYNAAVLLGWRVLRTTPDKLADGVKSVRLLMLA